MKSAFEYEVSLRVRHPSLDPDEICKTLGMSARHKQKAGANKMTPKGTPLEGVYQTSYCSFKLEHAGQTRLSELLKVSNRRLYDHRDFLTKIVDSGGSVEYFIGWFSSGNSGEQLDWAVLQEIANLKINLAIDVYSSRVPQ